MIAVDQVHTYNELVQSTCQIVTSYDIQCVSYHRARMAGYRTYILQAYLYMHIKANIEMSF